MRRRRRSARTGRHLLDAYWRSANYLSSGMIDVIDDPLLREPLLAEQVKPRLLGHRGHFHRLAFRGGVASDVAPETPGSMHEGGELRYALVHACHSAPGNPDLTALAVVLLLAGLVAGGCLAAGSAEPAGRRDCRPLGVLTAVMAAT